MRTNLTSAFVVAHGALPAMAPGGRMVFLSSSSAHAPQPGRSAYSASKAGLNAFAGACAEVERDGIAVHVVTTGPVATPMLDDVRFPMRTLEVAEVAETVVWLDTLPPNVTLPEVRLSSVDTGPFAPEPLRPGGGPRLGRTELLGRSRRSHPRAQVPVPSSAIRPVSSVRTILPMALRGSVFTTAIRSGTL